MYRYEEIRVKRVKMNKRNKRNKFRPTELGRGSQKQIERSGENGLLWWHACLEAGLHLQFVLAIITILVMHYLNKYFFDLQNGIENNYALVVEEGDSQEYILFKQFMRGLCMPQVAQLSTKFQEDWFGPETPDF